MEIKAGDNPFRAGTGHVPTPLPGRDDETELLTLVLNQLRSPRVKTWGKLAKPPYPPVKIVGPRGVGKTVLLNWLKDQADEKGIRFVSCEGLRPGEANFSMHKLLADISLFRRVIHWVKGFHLSAAEKFSAGVELNQASGAFTNVVGWAVRRRPLLLLLDEVQHYDLTLLRAVLQGSQKLIGEGYPLGLVMAGTPGLDSHLDKAESTFISRCQKIRISTLDDAATREALLAPFEREGVKVAPDALEALAAQTDNYPYFIQLVGAQTWNEMAQSGRKEVDAAMVERINEKSRTEREEIYKEAFRRLANKKLLPQARQTIALIEANGGELPDKQIVKALTEANPGVDDKRAREICDSLREDGLIWTKGSATKPGIPSFFTYFKEQDTG